MERDIEKTRRSGAVSSIASSTLDALAIVSIVFVFAAAVMAAAGASWRASAFMAIVGVLFDILFSYEFFIHALKRPSRFPWLAGLSSALPLLLVSGPFLAGWAGADLGSAAVRGYWLARAPLGSLSVVAALRLLRAARPFSAGRSSSRADAAHDDATRAVTPARLATIVGIVIVLAGAVASDALIIPGLSGSSAARREVAMDEIAAAPGEGAMIQAAKASGAIALRDDGRALLAATEPVSPSRYAVLSRGGLEAWFDVSDEARARGAAAAIAALASLAAAAAYAASLYGLSPSRLLSRRGTSSAGTGSSSYGASGARRQDVPAGSEELAGILGKRAR